MNKKINEVVTWIFRTYNEALEAAARQKDRFDEVEVVGVKVDGIYCYAVMAV